MFYAKLEFESNSKNKSTLCLSTGMKNSKFLDNQTTNYLEFIKHIFIVGCIFQFIGKILTSPVFIMLAISPKPRPCDIVNKTPVSDPDFRLILAIAQSQLWPGNRRQVLCFQCEVRWLKSFTMVYKN